MASVKDIFTAMDRWAPFGIQMDFDNAGLLVGRENAPVANVLVALDITQEVVREAVELDCQLIVAHHPVIFHPVKSITDGESTGTVLLTLAEERIAAICAHTNLDAAEGGVNDRLAQVLGLTEPGQLCQDGVDGQGRPYGIGRVGEVHEKGLSSREYAAFVKDRLKAAGVRYVDAGRPVEKVAVGGGSCGSMLADAVAAGCDTFVTADVKYDVFLQARALGVNLMDAGHYATENVVCPAVADYLKQAFPELTVTISARHREVYGCV
ncbi:MAG: Nif3-like dinuclear metal center hexameric protein [Clostridium sp.]|nr:Nif3-like dinuclear metal center hexameric protein [Clostridium sp.]